jgi:hypothetical protein
MEEQFEEDGGGAPDRGQLREESNRSKCACRSDRAGRPERQTRKGAVSCRIAAKASSRTPADGYRSSSRGS